MLRTLVIAATVGILGTTPGNAQSAHDVVAAHNSAYQSGDYSAYMEMFDENAVINLDGLMIQGRDAIAANYAANFRADGPTVRILRQGRVAGGGIIQQEAYVRADGEEVCCSVTTFRVRDGLIVRLDINSSGLQLGG